MPVEQRCAVTTETDGRVHDHRARAGDGRRQQRKAALQHDRDVLRHLDPSVTVVLALDRVGGSGGPGSRSRRRVPARSAALRPAPGKVSRERERGETDRHERSDVRQRPGTTSTDDSAENASSLVERNASQVGASQISSRSPAPMTTTSRSRSAYWRRRAGIVTRPVLSGSSSKAPEKNSRCRSRAGALVNDALDRARASSSKRAFVKTYKQCS